jgi:hypothetical protein
VGPTERVGRVSKKELELVFAGLDLVMGREVGAAQTEGDAVVMPVV